MCMVGGGGKPSVPPAPPKPAVEKNASEATTRARDNQRDRAKRAYGQQGAILTGGLGLGDTNTAKPLLG